VIKVGVKIKCNKYLWMKGVFLDPLLGDYWRMRYFYASDFFVLSLETCFTKEISGVLLEMFLEHLQPET
jgi:hypothetical protein